MRTGGQSKSSAVSDRNGTIHKARSWAKTSESACYTSRLFSCGCGHLELLCIKSKGLRLSYVWPLKMGHNQAQKGRAGRQARQDLYAANKRNHHGREKRWW